jgi:hypothetical protein
MGTFGAGRNGIFRSSFKGKWPRRGLIIDLRRQRELLESEKGRGKFLE